MRDDPFCFLTRKPVMNPAEKGGGETDSGLVNIDLVSVSLRLSSYEDKERMN